MSDGTPAAGALKALIEQAIEDHEIDVVSLDPFIKSHGLDENSNNAIDFASSTTSRQDVPMATHAIPQGTLPRTERHGRSCCATLRAKARLRPKTSSRRGSSQARCSMSDTRIKPPGKNSMAFGSMPQYGPIEVRN